MNNQPPQPTHGAVPIPIINALIKHFRETPMSYDVSEPFVRALSNIMLFNLEQAQQQEPVSAFPDQEPVSAFPD